MVRVKATPAAPAKENLVAPVKASPVMVTGREVQQTGVARDQAVDAAHEDLKRLVQHRYCSPPVE